MLIDALKDLKTTLAAEGYTDGVVDEVAADWEVNPKLLARKFEENFGVAPKDYVAPVGAPELDYAAIYERGMRVTYRQHPLMSYSSLNAAQRDTVKQVIDRNPTEWSSQTGGRIGWVWSK